MMKIITAMYTLKKGGAYDRFMMMVEALLEHQCEVHCLSLTPIPMNHPCYYNHVVAVPLGGKSALLAKSIVLLTFPWFSLLIGWREKADLFVSFGPLYGFLQAFPKWVLRKRMVTFIRLDLALGSKKRDSSDSFNLLNRIMEYVGLLFTDRAITVNTGIRRQIVEIIGRRKKVEVMVLFNDIPEIKKPSPEHIEEIRNDLGMPKQAMILVTAGILTPRKNVEILIRSLARVGRDDLFLVIVGGSTQKEGLRYRDYLEALIQKLDLTRKVILAPWVAKEKLWEILGACDLFVLPSLQEGMPNVLLEALGLGVPCIGSWIPGITDVLRHEELLFDPFDEETLAKKLGRFFSDAQYSNDIINLCRARKEAFVFDWKERMFLLATKGILTQEF